MSAGDTAQLLFTTWEPNLQHHVFEDVKVIGLLFCWGFCGSECEQSWKKAENFRDSWKLKYCLCQAWHISRLTCHRSVNKQVWCEEPLNTEGGQSCSPISTFLRPHTAPYPLSVQSFSLLDKLSCHSDMIKMAHVSRTRLHPELPRLCFIHHTSSKTTRRSYDVDSVTALSLLPFHRRTGSLSKVNWQSNSNAVLPISHSIRQPACSFWTVSFPLLHSFKWLSMRFWKNLIVLKLEDN